MSGPRFAVVALAVALAAGAALPAGASGPTIVATPNPVTAGSAVRIHGVVPGCSAHDQVTLISKAFVHTHDFAGLPAVFATVHAHAAYSVTTRIPAGRHGRYSISGRCGGGNLGLQRVLIVRARSVSR